MEPNNGRFLGEENTIYKAEFINTMRRELRKKIHHVIKIQRKGGGNLMSKLGIVFQEL